MILTCPSCTMRYIVAEGAVGPAGRKVRCAHCGHQWFQEGETGLDEALFDTASSTFDDDETPFENSQPADAVEDTHDFQSILRKEIESAPIPEGVRPLPEDTAVPDFGKKKKAKKGGDRLTGFILAGALYLVIIAVLLIMQPQISRAWPPSNMLYSLFGMTPAMPGEGLALDALTAEMAEGKITMRGTVLNLKEKDLKVPAIMATVVDKDGKKIDQVLIPPPVARLKGEGEAAFDAVYPKIPDGASNVTFAFSFLKAAASEPHVEEKKEEPSKEKAEEEGRGEAHPEENAEPSAPSHPAPHH